ncbi:MAG TPA: hypothetical protein VK658_12035 [Chryseolinea sp.]|nr:hypothetical protein [Chryseolinea sp.]
MNIKFTLLTIIAGTFITLNAVAQSLLVERRPVKTEESSEVESWTATFDQDMSFCQEMYGDFIKELVKTKVEKRGKNVLVAVKTQFPELSSLRIDQRAIFTPESAGTSVSFTFSPGYDVHFSSTSYKEEFAKAEKYVRNYVQYHYKKYYNDLIAGLQSKMKSLQSDIESNGKKTDKNNKSIASNIADGETDKTKTKNEKMKKENDQYAADTDSKRKELADIEDQLAKANDSLHKVLQFN